MQRRFANCERIFMVKIQNETNFLLKARWMKENLKEWYTKLELIQNYKRDKRVKTIFSSNQHSINKGQGKHAFSFLLYQIVSKSSSPQMTLSLGR